MSERGVFAVDRGVFDHPLFAPEPFTEREAWIWLIGACAWKAMRVRIKDTVFELERGQCAFSLRFLAEKWRWSKDKVARFLGRLKTETMIETQARRDATVITLCNYNEYQLSPGYQRDAERDAKCDAGETPTRRRRDKEEQTNKSNNGEEKEEPSLRSGRDKVTPDPQAKRGTRLPDDWCPDPDGLDFAIQTLGSADAERNELAKFRDHWRAQPGSKGVKTDWPATWRNWCRKAVEMRGNRGPPGRAQQPSFLEIEQTLLRQIHEADRQPTSDHEPDNRDGEFGFETASAVPNG